LTFKLIQPFGEPSDPYLEQIGDIDQVGHRDPHDIVGGFVGHHRFQMVNELAGILVVSHVGVPFGVRAAGVPCSPPGQPQPWLAHAAKAAVALLWIDVFGVGVV
jgi:hypothetical protein